MSTHTQGDWTIFHNNEYDETYIYAGEERIASVRRDVPEYEQNAILMHAAPDLLLQLKLLVRWAEDQGEKCSYALAAIRKAEGRAQ